MTREKILAWLLTIAGSAILIAIVFFLTLWILDEVTEPSKNVGDYPFAPITTNFPDSPKFIKISDLYFSGPYLLNEKKIINDSVFSILCKKESAYDIIYIGDSTEGYNLKSNSSYSCWQKNCDTELSVALFSMPISKYTPEDITKIKLLLEKMNSPVCSIEL